MLKKQLSKRTNYILKHNFTSFLWRKNFYNFLIWNLRNYLMFNMNNTWVCKELLFCFVPEIVFIDFYLLKLLSLEATETGIVKKILSAVIIFGYASCSLCSYIERKMSMFIHDVREGTKSGVWYLKLRTNAINSPLSMLFL